MPKLFSFLICLTAIASLVAQYLVSSEQMGHPGSGTVFWRMAGFFTVLTNTIVAASFLGSVITGRGISPALGGGLTLWICAVGIVYHLILAGLWNPEGLAWWADQGLHTAVPILVFSWWITVADKSNLARHHAFLWLIWPAVYCAYALTRGAASGFYPYPFLDVPSLGIGSVSVNIVGLFAAFLIGGLGLVALARRPSSVAVK